MIEPRIIDIKRAAKENSFFRKVLVTGGKSQVVLMCLVPGEEIGTEAHEGDQLLYAVKGEGVAVINGVEELFEKGTMLCVPAGTVHNVINTGDEPFKLFTIYAPPEHADGTIHETKTEADADEARISLSTVGLGSKAGLAANIIFGLAALMAVLSVAGFVHAFITPKEKVIFAPVGGVKNTPVPV